MNIVSRFTVEKKLQYQSDEGFRNNINFILTFGSIIIFGLFAIRPSITTITALIKDIDEYRKVNGVLIEKISILNEAQSHPEKTAKDTQLITDALPPQPAESSYIRNLNFIAAKNRIEVESINFTVVESDNLGTLRFSLIAYGTYPEMVSFIGDINRLLRITTLESIDIVPIVEADQAVRVTLEGKAYYKENL